MAKKMIDTTTFKALSIVLLTLLLLIPGVMIQNLISERQTRSAETIQKINEKWSTPQTVSGPILSVPFDEPVFKDGKSIGYQEKLLHITPQELKITAVLEPEERHVGIYKTIVYKSVLDISGSFDAVDPALFPAPSQIHWERAFVTLGVSDLRGITRMVDFNVNNRRFVATTCAQGGAPQLIVALDLTDFQADKTYGFTCSLNLNGSERLDFIPMGRTTQVGVSGAWGTPGFQGAFSPDQQIENGTFRADWNILSFNRNIPDTWTETLIPGCEFGRGADFSSSGFGVALIEPVDHYQQTMRSSKYSFMFVSLTFLLFFFVEVLTKRRIHPVQYALVGIALLLFYTLLLSVSEQWNFTAAYAVASVATIGLITAYASSIFKSRLYTTILGALLCMLYVFLYVVLQLEDVALLIGSIGLFVILGSVMFFSRKINWGEPSASSEAEQ